jgi:hypothetical protein
MHLQEEKGHCRILVEWGADDGLGSELQVTEALKKEVQRARVKLPLEVDKALHHGAHDVLPVRGHIHDGVAPASLLQRPASSGSRHNQTRCFPLCDRCQVAVVPVAPPSAWSAGANCRPRSAAATILLVLDVNVAMQSLTKYLHSPARLACSNWHWLSPW